jgi:hypothetical protein
VSILSFNVSLSISLFYSRLINDAFIFSNIGTESPF